MIDTWLPGISLLTSTREITGTGPSGSNSLRVIALGDEGWLFINDAYVSELDLSALSMPGHIFAFNNYFKDTGIAGKSTEFSGFVVWSVGEE